jgi:hypothetical protein
MTGMEGAGQDGAYKGKTKRDSSRSFGMTGVAQRSRGKKKEEEEPTLSKTERDRAPSQRYA